MGVHQRVELKLHSHMHAPSAGINSPVCPPEHSHISKSGLSLQTPKNHEQNRPFFWFNIPFRLISGPSFVGLRFVLRRVSRLRRGPAAPGGVGAVRGLGEGAAAGAPAAHQALRFEGTRAWEKLREGDRHGSLKGCV